MIGWRIIRQSELNSMEHQIMQLRASMMDAEARATAHQARGDEAVRALVDLERDLHATRRRINDAT